tara:strand:- start:389 stop:721 length:333 start_codon:yes stop_codon:yes gene_type:complete
MSFFFRWAWLLGVALIAPVSLPAGGAYQGNKIPEVRPRNGFSPLISGENCYLLTSPLQSAPPLKKIRNGTPLKVLRVWKSLDGQLWLKVQVTHLEILDSLNSPRRGWINV